MAVLDNLPKNSTFIVKVAKYNQRSIGLCKKMGFKETGESTYKLRNTEKEFPVVVMEKILE